MAAIEQVVIDSWHYWRGDPNTKYETANLIVGSGPNPTGFGPHVAKLLIGTPTAAKKEIVYDSLLLSLYFTQKLVNPAGLYQFRVGLNQETGSPLSAVLPNASIVLNAYNDIPLAVSDSALKESSYRSLFDLASTLVLSVASAYSEDADIILSHRSLTNKPKLKYTANDIVPQISNISPQGGNINAASQNMFTFSFGLPAVTGYVHQMPAYASAEMEWKLASGGTVYTITSPQNGRFTIPPGTFTDQTVIQWRMRAKTDDNVWSVWTDWFQLEVGDAGLQATGISPANQYLAADQDNAFRWKYSSNLGHPQAQFEAQISYDDSPGWVSLFSGTGTAESYTLPKGTLSVGGMKWRIRVKNDQGTWSDWSEEAQNRVIAPPAIPVINAVDGSTARPVITWQTTHQMAYQVRIFDKSGVVLLYDSGIVNSQAALHKIGIFLSDGQYLIRARVMNEYAMYSEWGAVNAFIDFDQPPAPDLVAATMRNGVRLTIRDSDASIEKIIVYRGAGGSYIPIAVLSAGARTWADYTCAGVNTYFVRAVVGDIFADSNMVAAAPQITGSILAPASIPEDIVSLKYSLGAPPERALSVDYAPTLLTFEGRDLPVSDFSGGELRRISFKIAMPDREEVERLRQIAGKKSTVLYRDPKGRKIYGIISMLPHVEKKRYTEVDIEITETDYSEVIGID